ncbi:hypothetical protein Nans01_29460 [Nocardiopsis ansamitocini]|uniref:Uncharacterized protein n=1 Tax=Nocardiopsis ansamitocini TaxID=1670832 RepID=A0A9W6P6X8_9ACTN|nr:hypothetical protein Nans01_29460 [Nocardiopsis ansamitocini]
MSTLETVGTDTPAASASFEIVIGGVSAVSGVSGAESALTSRDFTCSEQEKWRRGVAQVSFSY